MENGKQADASKLVNGFFSALDVYDRILFEAVKNPDGPKMDLEDASVRLKACIEALDALLGTVPTEIMAKSRTILEATQAKGGSLSEGGESEDDKVLKSLL